MIFFRKKKYTEEFLKAVAWDDIEKINAALDKGADIDAINELGYTSLAESSMHNYTEIVDALLKRGANPNIQCKGGQTAIILASVLGHIDTVRVLIHYNADTNIRDDGNNTALDIANDRGYDDVAKVLSEVGAKVTGNVSRCCSTCDELSVTVSKKLWCTLTNNEVSQNHCCISYKERVSGEDISKFL